MLTVDERTSAVKRPPAVPGNFWQGHRPTAMCTGIVLVTVHRNNGVFSAPDAVSEGENGLESHTEVTFPGGKHRV